LGVFIYYHPNGHDYRKYYQVIEDCLAVSVIGGNYHEQAGTDGQNRHDKTLKGIQGSLFFHHHYQYRYMRILHNSVFLEVSAVNTSLNIH